MPGVAVVNSGNYDLQIATGFQVDAFVLDDPIKGVLDNTTYVLDGTTEFASVMDSTTNITVKRGRRDVGDQFSAGTMSFTIQDVTGIFNPFDQQSPYYDTAEAKPGLAPMREVRFIRYDQSNNPEFLFSGYVVNFDYNFALGGLDTVTVYCADQFYLLAQTYMDTLNVTSETSGERIETVLDLPEVDFPLAPRDIATGTVTLGSTGQYTVPAGTNVLQYLTQINETAEFGRLFMSRAGVLTFQNRIGNTLSAPVASFHDDGTNFKYNGVGISFEADAVVNRAVVAGLDGNDYTAEDLASIATYFIQTTSITNSLLTTPASIQAAAEYLLNPEPEPRYTSVATQFLMLTDSQKDTLATVDIGDTISVEKTFASGTGTTQLAQELSVEGIEHYLDFSTGHRVLYSTAPTTIVYEFILGGYATTTTRTNVMANPNFETNTTSWAGIQTSGTTTLARITSDAFSGTACLEVTKGTGRAEAYEETPLSSIVAGNSYTISGYMKVPAGNETMTAGVRCLFFDNAGVQKGSFFTGTTSSLTNTSGWVRFSVTGTAPTGSQYVRAYFGQTSGATAGQKFLLDAVLVEQSSSALPYFDGTYADTYTGYTLTAQAWNGTANASTSTATWGENTSFIIGSTLDTEYVLG